MNIDKTKTYHVGNYTFVNFVNLDDDTIEKIRTWRNHPDIRKMMYNTEEISEEQHQRFISSLSTTDSKFYWLVFKQGNPVGVVSVVDVDYDNEKAELGYYLIPQNLNSGLSVEFLFKIHEFIFEIIRLSMIYGETNEKNANARLLDEFMGGVFKSSRVYNDTTYNYFETTKSDFINKKEVVSNWRNFVKYCKYYPGQ